MTALAEHADLDDWLTLAQISEVLGVKRTTLHSWVQRKLLQARYLSDVGHPIYRLGDAHALVVAAKLRGRRVPAKAAAMGWTRPTSGQPWRLRDTTPI